MDKGNRQYKLFDPIFREGHSLIYESEVPFYIRYLDTDKNVKTIAERELLTVRILTLGTYDYIESLRINLTSQSDLFFSSSFDCEEEMFEMMKRKQNIPGNFQQFPAYLMKLMNSLPVKQQKISADLVIYTDSKSHLTFNKNLQIKNIELLAIDLATSSHSLVEESVAFRYADLREKVKRSENRLKVVSQILMEKNPSLAAQISKAYNKF